MDDAIKDILSAMTETKEEKEARQRHIMKILTENPEYGAMLQKAAEGVADAVTKIAEKQYLGAADTCTLAALTAHIVTMECARAIDMASKKQKSVSDVLRDMGLQPR